MSEFLPLERHEIAQFGQLTAFQIDPDTVIVLELKPGNRIEENTAAILRSRLQSVFPSNPVIVIEPEKLSITLVDQPKASAATAKSRPTAVEIVLALVFELVAAAAVIFGIKSLVRRIRGSRAA